VAFLATLCFYLTSEFPVQYANKKSPLFSELFVIDLDLALEGVEQVRLANLAGEEQSLVIGQVKLTSF